jgi:hypothetical protein
MQLKSNIEKLYADTAKTSLTVLPSIAQAEEYLKESYEGRYLFELIQNAIDASKAIGERAKIKIVFSERTLKIYNTGKAFNKEGIFSVCRIGQSEKQGQDFIGHKGIGFKAVKELTDRPIIRTEFGSVIFDKNLTLEDKSFKKLDLEDIPLFFFPHYSPVKIESGNEGFVTLIELPLKDEIEETKPDEDFEELNVEQIVLLGNLERIEYQAEEIDSFFTFKKVQRKGLIEVESKEGKSFFMDLSPDKKIEIPKQVLAKLDKRERKTFEKDPTVEIKLVLKLDEKKQFKPVDHADFYLFYPLEGNPSGFSFLIHSYFTVSPDRKGFRETTLNSFLLKEIGEYISTELIVKLKKAFPNDLLRILSYIRSHDSMLIPFYDTIKQNLLKSQFLYDKLTKQYYSPAEVIIADECDEELFRDGLFLKKRLIFIDDERVSNWLSNELEIQYLGYGFIKDHIEEECRLRKYDLDFFQNLYNYISIHTKLDLTGKKIILADGHHLYSSDDDVFYDGLKKELQLSKAIKKKIRFLHRSLVISNSKTAKERIGLIQYTERELLKRLCNLFEDRKIDNKEILQAIYQLNVNESDLEDHRNKILLPFYNNAAELKWFNPLSTVIYIESPELKVMYPRGKYVPLDLFIQNDEEKSTWNDFFIDLGAWSIPGVYISKKSETLNSKDKRNRALISLTAKSSTPFSIQFDYHIDFPEILNRDFSNLILKNWKYYLEFISNPKHPRMQCRSKDSVYWYSIDLSKRILYTSFLQTLKEKAWLFLPNKELPFKPSDVVGIDSADIQKSTFQPLHQLFNLLTRNFSEQKDFFKFLDILHLNDFRLETYSRVLRHLTNMHEDPLKEKEFLVGYHKVLNLLFEVYAYHSDKSDDRLNLMRETSFLAYDPIKESYNWESPKNIIYVDNKFLYGRLPYAIKNKITPVFTLRDKNTFGQIAGKIGIVLSKSFEKSIVQKKPINESLLKDKFNFIPELIAFVEDVLDRPLTQEEVKGIGNFKMNEQSEVRILYKLVLPNTIETFEELESYSIDDEENEFTLLYVKSALNNIKDLSNMLAELVEAVVDKEVKRLGQQIFNFLEKQNDASLNHFLDNNDISEERISDIRNTIHHRLFDSKTSFWISISSALEGNLNHRKEFKFVEFLSQFDLNKATQIEYIAGKLKYDDLLNSTNIPLIQELFRVLPISLYDYNQFAIQKLNFSKHYNDKLEALKSRSLENFRKILLNYLQKKTIQEKEKFVDIVNTFQDLRFEKIDDFLDNDQKHVLNLIKSNFPYLNDLDSIVAFTDGSEAVDNNYYLFKEGLKKRLKEEGLGDFNLEQFLRVNNKNRSLLFFDETEDLIQRIKVEVTSYKAHSGSNISGNEDEKLTDDDFEIEKFNFQENPAENNSTSNGHSSERGNGGWGGGSPYDGAVKNPKIEVTGLAGEKLVYNKLKKLKHLSVKWVSRNAYRAKVNSEGSDHHGYDIEYVDKATGTKKYVEVKASSYANKTFIFTKTELKKALEFKEDYLIILVENVFDEKSRRYHDLGNIFLLKPGEDFMRNSKFKAENELFTISLKGS